jgi:hypothetical protein
MVETAIVVLIHAQNACAIEGALLDYGQGTKG